MTQESNWVDPTEDAYLEGGRGRRRKGKKQQTRTEGRGERRGLWWGEVRGVGGQRRQRMKPP